VIIYQPNAETVDFGDLPIYSLATLDAKYWDDEKSCPLCKEGIPAVPTKL
jgi:hypothetical protein